MERIAAFLEVLPSQMRDPVLFAIPFFLLLLILEWTAARKLEHIEARPASGAFHTRDSWASISMGLVSVATTAGWKFIALLGYAAIYAYLAPWHLSAQPIAAADTVDPPQPGFENASATLTDIEARAYDDVQINWVNGIPSVSLSQCWVNGVNTAAAASSGLRTAYVDIECPQFRRGARYWD